MAGYLGSVPVPQATQHRETFTATAAQTSFATAGYTPQFVDVYLNGVHLSPADVTATNGSDVVLTACLVNDIVDVVSYTPFEVADQTFTGTTTMTDVVAASLDISGNIDVDGTSNLDIVDIDGAVNMASTLAFNVASSYASAISIRQAANAMILSGGTDGYYFNRSDNSVTDVHINGAGIVTMPKQPAFFAVPASDQNNFAVNSDVVVVFGTEKFDQGNNFASNTFTAPVTGKYQLNLTISLLNVDSASTYYYIAFNTSNLYISAWIDPDYGQDSTQLSISMSVLADMDASDTVTAEVRQGSGTQQTDIDTFSYFSGYLAC